MSKCILTSVPNSVCSQSKNWKNFKAIKNLLLWQSNYEPAVVLCIPDLPIGFFITIFSVYSLALFGMVGGYIVVLICLKKKQAQIQNTNIVQTTDYKGLERAALTRYVKVCKWLWNSRWNSIDFYKYLAKSTSWKNFLIPCKTIWAKADKNWANFHFFF